MKFLFNATVIHDGIRSNYKVYEFKLQHGRYKAEVINPAPNAPKQIIFWKGTNQWISSLEEVNYLAEILGRDIDILKQKK